ncbi:hypothetical protein WH52_10085 [Tenacibaculum holothuriorum]|uniref:Phytase-like domain-containing protein n=1 Tax=Tenacibaculum holothuriorum TaxID=1635173 RepID=A0A1Y2PCW0_9FLAO|nr:hypothetical protein WH52_10085 [Tenacibaculum holothuriorum]
MFSVLFSCKTTDIASEKKVELKFLDEYVFPINKEFKGNAIGGLSGIDAVDNDYFLAVDDARDPRIFKAKIIIENSKIKDVEFIDVLKLNKKESDFFRENHLDLESVLFDSENQELVLTSEGSIKKGKNPLLFSVSKNGKFKTNYQLPEKFLVSSKEPRHNGTFEGLSHSADKKGYWTAMEFPLKSDGEEPSFGSEKSYVRFTYVNKELKQTTKEYVYNLSSISRPLKGHVNLNGLTDILEYKPNHFFVLERTYQSGYKNSNIVRIYEAIINKKTTNTLQINALVNKNINPMKKRLIFDFESVRNQLTDSFVDNIEGITFGPKLKNGNQSLILVSDDNFQVYGKQLNQFVLIEIKE